VTIEEVDLHPEYDVSFFRDIPVPDGAFVVHLKDAEATKSYWQGEPPASAKLAPPEKGWSSWWWAAGVALVVAAGTIIQRRRAGTGWSLFS
jgi:hypothetical protein